MNITFLDCSFNTSQICVPAEVSLEMVEKQIIPTDIPISLICTCYTVKWQNGLHANMLN